MMGKGLFAFIAFLAVVFESISAQMACDNLLGCTKCLAVKDTSCASHVNKDSSGCMSEDECNSKEGECLLGKDKASNKYICGSTCVLKSDSTCDDCLSTDFRGGKRKKSDCAWFVRGNEDPQCIYKKRCDDRGFDNGKCIKGKKFGDNSKKCSRKPPTDFCPRLKNCGKCLKGKRGQSCAWQVDGNDASCVAEDKCEGDCFKSSEIFNIKKTCKRIKKPKPAGIEKCKDFDGLCTDCLNNGCAWVDISHWGKCYDSCSDGPTDVGCYSLPVPEEPVVIFTRNLLRFDSEASKMCSYFRLEYKNNKLCGEQDGGCEACVETQLYTAPGEFYAIPPTCHYHTGKFCNPNQYHWWFGSSLNTCALILLPEGTNWPDLLGQTAIFAIEFLNNKYGEGVIIEVLPPGSLYTNDFRLDRVRLNVDDSTPPIIIEVPEVG